MPGDSEAEGLPEGEAEALWEGMESVAVGEVEGSALGDCDTLSDSVAVGVVE